MNPEEKKESEYLKHVLEEIEQHLSIIDQRINLKKEEIDYMNTHMQEHKRDMDHLEKNALRETVFNYTLQGEHAIDRKKQLFRLRNIPFFGRINFKENSKKTDTPIYIGVHNLQATDGKSNLVFDWRAPISSMFYDYETGAANYQTQNGTVNGEITRKRQFRIREGKMEYMIDSELTIHDDVLQRELSQSASGKMRNIVATIQREQNAIIRNEEARHLIIQGVAGSGKTSIALHRIAFLLYKFKDTISSQDILIISPNKVFASYISNVLPELGEETVEETSMEEIADALFEYQVKFQNFFDQVAELLERDNEDLQERIRFKASADLLKKMDAYMVHLENTGLDAQDIFVGGKPVPAWFITETFQKYNRLPMLLRFNEVVRDIVNNVYTFYRYEVTGKERTELHTTVRKMFPSTNLRQLYKGFYDWLECEYLLKLKKGGTYEYSDVFPLLYLKMKLEGLKPIDKVKHLVVDEMQDYSAVQYKILNILYPCKKTILGDVNQSVNPFSASNIDLIQGIFSDSLCMTMLKSYRSTYEITEFSKRVGERLNVEAIERHGDAPELFECKNSNKEAEKVKQLVSDFRSSEYKSMGIICKTQSQADFWHNALENSDDLYLLNARSVAFGSGIVVTTAHLAKGLEFDVVVIPDCTAKNYRTQTDRQMLYVACTRAMHQLKLTAVKAFSPMIN